MTLSNPGFSSIDQMRLLRLLQCQLQQFLTSESQEERAAENSTDSAFDVRIVRPFELDDSSHLQPVISVSESSKTDDYREGISLSPIWVLQIVEDLTDPAPVELYARAGIYNYWQLDLNNVELYTYQRICESGYSQRRVLQVGDRVSPDKVPLTVQLQEPVPLHFMTRTLNGQQTYQTHALPFSFSRTPNSRTPNE